jgi:hypothetical protein
VKARNDVRRRCEKQLRLLDVPRPFDVSALCESVAQSRGRPVLVHRVPYSVGPCGWWAATAEADHIYVQADASVLHQQLIILHELSHMLLEHRADDALADLFPLTDAAAARILARSGYEQVQEQEAELLASLILADAGWDGTPSVVLSGVPADASVVVERLAQAFGPQRNR